MKIPIHLNYLDKMPLYNFHIKLYFTLLKMKIPIRLNYFFNGKIYTIFDKAYDIIIQYINQ